MFAIKISIPTHKMTRGEVQLRVIMHMLHGTRILGLWGHQGGWTRIQGFQVNFIEVQTD